MYLKMETIHVKSVCESCAKIGLNKCQFQIHRLPLQKKSMIKKKDEKNMATCGFDTNI